MDNLVLLGGGGYFAGVADSIMTSTDFEIVGFTDPVIAKNSLGIKYLGTDDVLYDIYKSGVKKAHITVGSIGNYSVRKKLVERAKEIGFELVTVIDKTACVSSNVSLGEMVYVGKNAVVNSTAKIGSYSIINTSSIVEHGCDLGDFSHVAPGAVLAADIKVGFGSHIGINSSIRQGLVIGENAMIGAGSVVLRDVSDNETVYGVVDKKNR